jgi:general secretion pathway protein I
VIDRPLATVGRDSGRHAPRSRRPVSLTPAAQRGFTLIEVVVAFALLAMAMALLLGTLTGAARQVRWASDAGRASLHAQSLLDQTGMGEVLQPGRSDGTFEDGRYRWTLSVEPFADLPASQAGVDPFAPRLLRLALAVQWREGGPGERLELQSLRLVAPDPAQGGMAP